MSQEASSQLLSSRIKPRLLGLGSKMVPGLYLLPAFCSCHPGSYVLNVKYIILYLPGLTCGGCLAHRCVALRMYGGFVCICTKKKKKKNVRAYVRACVRARVRVCVNAKKERFLSTPHGERPKGEKKKKGKNQLVAR